MSRFAAVGRADLLRLLSRKTDAEAALDCIGYRSRRETAELPSFARPDAASEKERRGEEREGIPRDATQPAKDAHVQGFLLPVTAQSRDPETQERPPETVKPKLTEAQLSRPRGVTLPSSPPLAPWSRLVQFVRQSLGMMRAGRRLDTRKLLRWIAGGRPLLDLPLRQYPGWAPEAVLLLDRSREMIPFRRDLDHVRDRVLAERGAAGLRVIDHSHPPGRPELAGLRAGTPVLALSAFGQLARSPGVMGAWLELGESLARRDLPLGGLLPCPRQRWLPALAKRWRCAVWDRLARPSRNRGLSALPDANHDSGVEALLRLLSPASLIRPGLLRRVRLLLGAEADVAAEFDAWFHEDCWTAPREFGIRAEKINPRLEALKNLPPTWNARRAQAGYWIEAFHRHCSAVISGEARMRLNYVGVSAEDGLAAVESAAELMRELARRPGSPAGNRTGLPQWFGEVVERMPPDLRGEAGVSAGLAAAHCFDDANSEIQWPEGTDLEVAEEVINSLTGEPEQETNWQVALRGNQLRFTLADEPEPTGLRLAQISARRLVLHLAGDPGLPASSRPLERDATIDLPRLSSLMLATDRGGLYLLREKRPAWARSMGQDRYGCYSDVEVSGVTFRLRWIPPGSFRMGEEKRSAMVSHTRGFWLAETQTTQALWNAVGGRLADPSYFKDPKRPVESVTWHECRDFCEDLEKRVEGLSFSLPSEAQWEYACRAGTDTRFNNGSDEEDAMNDLGWCYENSAVGEREQTHPVGLKERNAWGMYDLHGNVLEWCLDQGLKLENTMPRDPVGDIETGGRRALRGGSWAYDAGNCRSAIRVEGDPGNRDSSIGFRLAAGSKLKDQSGAVGWWTEGADAPGPWDRDSVKRPTSGGFPAWSTYRKSDGLGVDGIGRLAAFKIDGVEFSFRWIGPGRFVMGSPEEEPGRYGDEGPQHEVAITRGFWLGVTPVTQEQWERVMDSNPSKFKGKQRPVEQVSWEDAAQYVARINSLVPELSAGLPTEAQWEYACRADTPTPFHDGMKVTNDDGLNERLQGLGWYTRNAGGESHEVARLPANDWGLHDMHGNVWEWCQDSRRDYTEESVTDPMGPTGGGRALRGGSWAYDAGSCRSAIRDGSDPGSRYSFIGFRLAAGLELTANQEAERAEPLMKGAEQIS